MNSSLHVLAPASLTAAVKAAAERELTSNSEYVRRAVIERLRADGIDPAQFASARSSVAA
jgi:hypothetical protein